MTTCIYLWLLWLIILHDYPGYKVTSFYMLAMVNSVVKFPTGFVVSMFTYTVSVTSLSWLLYLSEHAKNSPFRGHSLSSFRLSPYLKESHSIKHQNWLALIISTPMKVVLYHCYTGKAHNLKHITLRNSFTYRWYCINTLTNFSFISSFHLKFTYTYMRACVHLLPWEFSQIRVFISPSLNTEPLESDTVQNLALSLFSALDWFRSYWVKDYLAMIGSTWGWFLCLMLRLCRLWFVSSTWGMVVSCLRVLEPFRYC